MGTRRDRLDVRQAMVHVAVGVAQNGFGWLLFGVVVAVCLLVPGFTARTAQDHDARPLFALLGVTAFLVVAGAWFGRASLAEALLGIGVTTATGVLLASLALLASSLTRRVAWAAALAYGITLVLVLGTLVIYGVEAGGSNNPDLHNKAVLVLNPFVAAADAVAGRAGTIAASSPLTPLSNLLLDRTGSISGPSLGPTPLRALVTGGLGRITVRPATFATGSGPPYAAYSLGCFAVISAGAVSLALRRTSPLRP